MWFHHRLRFLKRIPEFRVNQISQVDYAAQGADVTVIARFGAMGRFTSPTVSTHITNPGRLSVNTGLELKTPNEPPGKANYAKPKYLNLPAWYNLPL
jgi:hypothetical protein